MNIVTGAIFIAGGRLLARWSIDRLWQLPHHRAAAHYFGGYPGWLFFNTLLCVILGLAFLIFGIQALV